MTQADTTTDDAGRSRAIAAIHAFADYLAEHPDVPVPTDLQAHRHLPYDAVAAVDAYAAAHPDMKVRNSGSVYWCAMDVRIGDLDVMIGALTTTRPEPK
jgi:hypothetical protein